MFRKVVVGMDGRESGREAIAFARAVAPGAELVLVRAFTYGTIGLLAQAAGWDDAVRESTLEALARAREEAGVDADVEAIADRSPARALQDAAARANADLLILGSGHHGRFGRVVLGDFGRAVMAG